MELNDYIAVNGWTFELVVQNDGDDVFYQCRGEVSDEDIKKIKDELKFIL